MSTPNVRQVSIKIIISSLTQHDGSLLPGEFFPPFRTEQDFGKDIDFLDNSVSDSYVA